MRIRVGPFEYAVRLVHGHIRHEGRACFGLCDNLRQEILISDLPHEDQRLQVFFHELMHAWWYHFGANFSNEETVADLVGMAMTDFTLQAVQCLRGPADRSARSATRRACAAVPARPTGASTWGERATAPSRNGLVESYRVTRVYEPARASRSAALPGLTGLGGWVIRVYDPCP